MPAKKKSAKSTKKASVKMRDLKPSKDAKGGALRHTQGVSKRQRLY
jgi:hypothetical protein